MPRFIMLTIWSPLNIVSPIAKLVLTSQAVVSTYTATES